MHYILKALLIINNFGKQLNPLFLKKVKHLQKNFEK